jgi:hypothetical protein
MSIGPVELVVFLVIAGLYIWALVVCAMKARWVFFVLGIFSGLFALIGALLPAKPGSSWALKHGL